MLKTIKLTNSPAVQPWTELPDEEERLRGLAAIAGLAYFWRSRHVSPSLPLELLRGWHLSQRRLNPWAYQGMSREPDPDLT